MAVTNFLSSLLLGLDKVSKLHTNLLHFSDDNGKIVPAKTKRVAQRNIDFAELGFIESKIESGVEIRIIGEVVDRRRNNSFFDG